MRNNKWKQQLLDVPPRDRSWVEEDSVYVDVQSPLWQETRPAGHDHEDPEEIFWGGFDEA